MHSTGSDAEDELDLLRSLRHRYVDGLVITALRLSPAHLEALRGAAVPVVVIGTLPDGFPVDSVRISSKQGVQLAVSHLVEQGRRSVGFVNGPLDTGPGQARREGYETALATAGLSLDQSLVAVASDFTHRAGYEATRALLGSARPDALFCANDLLALGALKALSEASIRVPAEVAVVGLDNTELAALATPALSSVSLGSAERGRLAARLLLERLADPGLAPRRFEVQPSLVIRESSSP